MLTPRQIFRRMRDLVFGRRLDHDVDDELRFHIEMQTAAFIRQGMSPGRARAKAESDFGIGAQVTDHVRNARGLSAANLVDDSVRDVRFALRSLVRTPAFTILAISTLAIGIGATTAMFSVVNGVLLRSLPFPDAAHLVELRESSVTDGRSYNAFVSAPNFVDWRAQARSFDLMAAFRDGEVTVLGLTEPVPANLAFVSQDYFKLFGMKPMLGRALLPEEHVPTGAPAIVVGERFWRDQLGARRDLENVQLTIYSSTYTVVGVMPRGVGFPADVQLWAALEPQSAGEGRDSHNNTTIGHLANGITFDQARAELDGIAKRLEQAYPDNNRAIGASVRTLREAVVGPVQKYLRLLLGAVVLVLLVACVNLASANLARGTSRSRELSIRTVLGAGRARLVRQLLTESLLVALVGGAVGAALAHWLVRSMLTLNSHALPRAEEIGIDVPVLLFALGATVACGLFIGVLPALQLGGGRDLRAGVSAGGRGTAVGRSATSHTLVAVEVALAVVLLIGAGLVVRSFRQLLAEDAGFSPDGVLAVTMSLPGTRYPTGNQRSAYYTEALEALRTIPGVAHASFINIAPLSRGGFGGGMSIEGDASDKIRYSDYRVVSPDYFATMRIPLLAGRLMTDADDSTSTHVTVINQAMARKFFGDADPIGKRLRELGMDSHRAVPLTVVGVVGDVRSADLAQPAGPQHFVSYRQRPDRASFGVFLLRTNVEPASVGPIVRARLRALDVNVLTRIETAVNIRERSLGDRRFTMVLLGGFAVLGLVLAVIGVYGVLAYTVARRTREIGIRMALGAQRTRVVGMILGDSLTPVIAGSVVGIAAALVVTRLMRTLLYGVTPTDPMTYAVVAVILLGAAALASLVPAARAARVDPIVALREE